MANANPLQHCSGEDRRMFVSEQWRGHLGTHTHGIRDFSSSFADHCEKAAPHKSKASGPQKPRRTRRSSVEQRDERQSSTSVRDSGTLRGALHTCCLLSAVKFP